MRDWNFVPRFQKLFNYSFEERVWFSAVRYSQYVVDVCKPAQFITSTPEINDVIECGVLSANACLHSTIVISSVYPLYPTMHIGYNSRVIPTHGLLLQLNLKFTFASTRVNNI